MRARDEVEERNAQAARSCSTAAAEAVGPPCEVGNMRRTSVWLWPSQRIMFHARENIRIFTHRIDNNSRIQDIRLHEGSISVT